MKLSKHCLNSLIKHLLIALLVITSSQSFAEGKTTFYHYDLLGSPVATTDEQGNVIWREEYSPWGEKLLNEDASHDNVRDYTEHVHDKETGLTYMQARYYDPQIGRFMGVDPVGFQENNPIYFNRYVYAGNNPYKFTDPNGESYGDPDAPEGDAFNDADWGGIDGGENSGYEDWEDDYESSRQTLRREFTVPNMSKTVIAGVIAGNYTKFRGKGKKAFNILAKAFQSKKVATTAPKNIQSFKTPRAAFRAAKRDAGHPTSQTHITHEKNIKSDALDSKKTATEFDFGGGRKVQKHPTGHTFRDGSVYDKPHFNNHGVGETKGHYEY